MKKTILAVAIAIAAFSAPSYAIDLKDILGQAGSAVGNVVDGLLTQTDITVEQMAGTWTATGPAVCFQSENALKKAGGSVMASTIENQLAPYYKQYGLTGAVLTIESSGKFTLKVKGISLNGQITKRSDGNFDFAFTPFGSVKLGSIKAYVEKPMSGLNVMFDASKLKSLISTLAGLTGNSLAKTASSVLDSYNGLCVGFAFNGSSTSTNTNTNNNSNNNNNSLINSNTVNSVTNALKGLFGK